MSSDDSNIIVGNLYRKRDGQGWAFTDENPHRDLVHRPARVAHSLALAHELEAALRAGQYASRADMARTLGFTRARITQLLDLTHLAPDIQEQIAFLESIDGVEPISERALRDAMACLVNFKDQRRKWAELTKKLYPRRQARR